MKRLQSHQLTWQLQQVLQHQDDQYLEDQPYKNREAKLQGKTSIFNETLMQIDWTYREDEEPGALADVEASKHDSPDVSSKDTAQQGTKVRI